MEKVKELATVLDGVAEIMEDVKSAADLISQASKKTIDVLSAVKNLLNVPESSRSIKEEPAKKKSATKKKAEPEPESRSEPEDTAAEKEYTKEEVRKFLAGVAGKHRAEVKELLTKYGADTLTQLDPVHYAAIMADAEALLNA